MENKADWKSLRSVHKQKDVVLANLAYVALHNRKLRLHFCKTLWSLKLVVCNITL